MLRLHAVGLCARVLIVLVAIIREELGLELSLSQMQILSVNAFEQMPLAELFARITPQSEVANPWWRSVRAQGRSRASDVTGVFGRFRF